MEKINVLVVEDEHLLFKLLEKKIARHNLANKMSMTLASTIEEAIEIYPKQKFDGVFLDLNLPTTRGISTLSTAKTIFEIPIVVYSSIDYEENLPFDCLELGAQDFISKKVIIPEDFYRRMCFAIIRSANK